MKRILFANHAQFEGAHTNLGDWAIFEEMVESLSDEIKNGNVEILVPSSDPAYTDSNYPVKAFKRGGIRGILNTCRAIFRSDVVLIGGGEIVQDRSSMVYIPYQLIRPFIAKLLGKKLFAYAIGIGTEDEISAIGRIQSKFVLNMFDVITVRDEKSYRILKSYLGVSKPQIYLTADPALNLEASLNIERVERPYVVISVRSVYHRNRNLLPFSIRKKLKLVPKQYYKEINVFKEDIAKIVNTVIQKYNYEVKFLNTYIGEQMSAADDAFTQDVIKKIASDSRRHISVIDPQKTPAEVKEVLSRAEFILSVPLHPLILGASENVPVLSLAYASKNICFMEQIKQSQYIYPVENIGERVPVSKILTDIDFIIKHREEHVKKLREITYRLKKIEKENVRLLLELLGSISC